MAKVIDIFGNLDNGDITSDTGFYLLPKRVINFVPYDEDKMNDAVKFVREHYPDLSFGEFAEEVDKMVFDDQSN